MSETADGGGRFDEVVLAPRVVVAEANMIEKARALHSTAHERCFVASSVNFPVRHEPEIVTNDR